MKSKKRKTTSKYLPKIKEAIKKNKVFVRKTSDRFALGDYNISFGADFYKQGSIEVFVNTNHIGKITELRLRGQGKLTQEAQTWLTKEIDKIIIMHKIGAYQGTGDDSFKTKGQVRWNSDTDEMETWNGFYWESKKRSDAHQAILDAMEEPNQPKRWKRKYRRRTW